MRKFKSELFGIEENKKGSKYDYKLIVDALALKGLRLENEMNNKLDNLSWYINDVRKDINQKERSEDDILIQNIEFISCLINGWPSIFAVTIKNIKKGEWLWCYYGDRYHQALQTMSK